MHFFQVKDTHNNREKSSKRFRYISDCQCSCFDRKRLMPLINRVRCVVLYMSKAIGIGPDFEKQEKNNVSMSAFVQNS